jgi:hypothetical protein
MERPSPVPPLFLVEKKGVNIFFKASSVKPPPLSSKTVQTYLIPSFSPSCAETSKDLIFITPSKF